MAMPQFNLGQRWANIGKTVGEIAQMQKSTAERKRAEKMKGEQMLQQTFKDIYGFAEGWGKEQTRKREREDEKAFREEQFKFEKEKELTRQLELGREQHREDIQRKLDRRDVEIEQAVEGRRRAEEIELQTKRFEIQSDQWDEEFSNKVNQQNLEALRLTRQDDQDRINRAIDRQREIAREAQIDRQWEASQKAINEGNRLEQLSIKMELAEQTQELRASVIEDISNMFPASVLTEKNIEDSIASASALISSNTFNEDDENENETITNMLIESAELMLRGRLEATLNEDAESSAALGDPKFIASTTEAYNGIRDMVEFNMNPQIDKLGLVIWGEKEQNELNSKVTDIINKLRESGMYPEATIVALEAFHGMSLDRTPKLPSPVVTVAQEPGWLLFQGEETKTVPETGTISVPEDDAAPPIYSANNPYVYDRNNPIKPERKMFSNDEDFNEAMKAWKHYALERGVMNLPEVLSRQGPSVYEARKLNR